METERLQKIISQAGVVSRRKAEELIKQQKVLVNGKIAILGQKASFKDEIIVDGMPIAKEQKVYYMLNKPEKSLSSVSDPHGRLTVIDLIDVPEKVFPIGRLDWDTSGTLLLTNDGELANRLIHPSYGIKRVYRARLKEPLTKEQLDFLNSQDVVLEGKKSLQEVTKVDTKTYIVVLTVGTYHHVKRLFELVDNQVFNLTRIEFAGLTHVKDLSKGEYRKLKPKELIWLKQLTKML